MLWLWMMVACQTTPPPNRSTLDPQRATVEIRDGLAAALQLWRSDRYADAQQAVQQTYVAHFEPVEPLLSDEVRLSLEYSFGQLTWQMRRGGADPEMTAAVDALQTKTANALANASRSEVGRGVEGAELSDGDVR